VMVGGSFLVVVAEKPVLSPFLFFFRGFCRFSPSRRQGWPISPRAVGGRKEISKKERTERRKVADWRRRRRVRPEEWRERYRATRDTGVKRQDDGLERGPRFSLKREKLAAQTFGRSRRRLAPSRARHRTGQSGRGIGKLGSLTQERERHSIVTERIKSGNYTPRSPVPGAKPKKMMMQAHVFPIISHHGCGFQLSKNLEYSVTIMTCVVQHICTYKQF
jgi:hypothetical protein